MSNTFKFRKYFCKTDLIIVSMVLIFSAAGFFILGTSFSDTPPQTAEIRVNGEVYKTVNLSELSEPYIIDVEGKLHLQLELSREGVRFVESKCKDKLCVHSGLIKSGQSAACLPAGVSVYVSSTESSEIDALVG